MKAGKVTAVKTAAVKESGVTLSVAGLATATYNVRIIYRNPGPREARLTFFADGAGLAANDYPYFIPVFLPPTEGDEFETASFFFSLYSGTRTLESRWLPGQQWGKPDPRDDDYGTVLVDAIELIKVEPVVLPQVEPSTRPTKMRNFKDVSPWASAVPVIQSSWP